uniref:Uncharacterized protein n=1 Tax=Macrostomum lignano TaxID=282301 RepID=A0A1I8F748_9PLAT
MGQPVSQPGSRSRCGPDLPLHHARLEACELADGPGDFRHNNRGTDPRLRAHGHHEQFSHQT